jgi:hypothetical protein
VEARIDPEDEGRYLVKLRIEQEAQNFGKMEVERMEEGWQSYGYDKVKTLDILTRIKLLVKDFKPSDAFYERYKRGDSLRSSVPKVLEPIPENDNRKR